MSNILMVPSAADHWRLRDGTEHPTGYWAEEFVVPHRAFRDAGHTVDVATPGGVAPTVDAVSLAPEQNGGDEDKVAALRTYIDTTSELTTPLKLDEVALVDYDAIFVPGGHGPMEDLVVDADLGRLLVAAVDNDVPVAALCHGPAGLLSAVRTDGSWAFAGRRMTSFTDDEERQAGLADNAEWLLETRLRQNGADMHTGSSWSSHVVRDGQLVTAQNPNSSAAGAQAVLDTLAQQA